MKKTILAIAIPALFASAANAATVYDKDGAKFDVNGRVHARYQGEEDSASFDTTKNSFVKDQFQTKKGEVNTYARMGLSGKVALNNTWSALAMGEWQVESENSGADDKQFASRHVFAGFDGSQYGQFLFGQTDTAAKWGVRDRADIFEELGNVGNLDDGRQEGQVIYRGAWDGAFFNASYISHNSSYSSDEQVGINTTAGGQNNANDAGLKNGYAVGAGYNFTNGFGFGASYQDKKFEDVTAGSPADGVVVTLGDEIVRAKSKEDWALGASYAYDAFYVGAMYNQSKIESYADESMKARGYEIAGSYTIDAWKLLAGYNFLESEATHTGKSAGYADIFDRVVLGVEYAFTGNLKSYANYAIENAGEKDDQFEFGMQYNF
ncbi:porin [Aeromonas allosaccharophila]|uniref:porin n=1 Tax=Aeromonas allosaccharophila TaxID=656 RepID=UPI003438EC72